MSTNAIRVLCVDDHQFLAEGLAARINLERDMECVGSLPSADDLIARVGELKPNVVVIDLQMPGPDSLEMISALRARHEDVGVLVFSAHVRDHFIDQALKNGAAGYFSKNDPPGSIIEGIRKVAKDETAFSEQVEERMKDVDGARSTGGSKLQKLTPRELEVLRLIGRGLSRADIARQLFRSMKTIDAHHTSIMRKLDIHDRAELTRYAIVEGLVEQ